MDSNTINAIDGTTRVGCRDDCHTYDLYDVNGRGIHQKLHFMKMDEDGNKDDGTTNEDVISMLIHRIKVLNEKFPCRENSIAITKLQEVLMWLNERTRDRVGRGVEGEHKL